jgi:hypothetical protein
VTLDASPSGALLGTVITYAPGGSGKKYALLESVVDDRTSLGPEYASTTTGWPALVALPAHAYA